MMICPNCKASCEEGARFCQSCGLALTGQTPQIMQEPPKDPIPQEVPVPQEKQDNPSPEVPIDDQGSAADFYAQAPKMKGRFSGKAITAFVLSLVGLCLMGIILGAIGVTFSTLALHDMKQDRAMRGKGLAIAGLVISIVDIVLTALLRLLA